jgi:ribosomal protein S18 acetylase RimI-like enzyme
MRTIIERAGHADIPVLVELMSQFHAESSYALDREWAAASFAQLLRDEQRGAVWIARCGADAAGHVVLVLRHSMEFGGLAGVVDDLFVRPQFRRQGVGSALLSALLEACRKLQVVAVHVEVGPDNVAASTLYQAFGLRGHSTERETLTVRLSVEEHAV